MNKLITFATIAAVMATQRASQIPYLISLGYAKSYNDIPNKHKKHKRGKPK